MGTIWVRELTGGLDTRRMPETTKGGALIVAKDGHINRGGEFEGRAAFVDTYTLPAGTVGIAAGKSGILVFGHDEAPALPVGVSYMRLQHPDGETALVDVPSFDLYSGKVYAVGVFEDGSRYHFFDGVRVPDWFDGRARAEFRVTSGGVTPATKAASSFEITGGTLDAGVNRIAALQVNGVAIIGAAVNHTGDNEDTAAAIASAINGYASVPEYTASAAGAVVTIEAATASAAANGRSVTITAEGDVTTTEAADLSGGANSVTATLADITVDDVQVIAGPIEWAVSNEDTAAAIATAINSYVSEPDYVATAVGDKVNISAAENGSAANGRLVLLTLENGFGTSPSEDIALEGGGGDPVGGAPSSGSFDVTAGTANPANQIASIKINNVALTAGSITHTGDNTTTATAIANAVNAFISAPNYSATSSGAKVTITSAINTAAVNGLNIVVSVVGDVTIGNAQAMAGGVDAQEVFQPGEFVKTIGSKMYSTSGPNMHFSGIKVPTGWKTDYVGAGFIDMSAEASGAEELIALAEYQNYLAIFAEGLILIWYVDPDPSLNKKAQTLRNTGTLSPRSVTQFGDNDIFYLHESGLRSLRARDSSNAAATTDIGVPIDTLIVKKLRSMTREQRAKVVGLIEPTDGRFWLVFPDEIFVFSYFSGSKVSAWSLYTPTKRVGGELTGFTIDGATVFRSRVYLRSGDTVMTFGGGASEPQYDETEPEMHTPYLDGDTPTRQKKISGVDAAVEGQWEIALAFKPTTPAEADKVAVVTKTTFNADKLPAEGSTTHVSIRFKGKGGGFKKVSSAVIHYEADEDED